MFWLVLFVSVIACDGGAALPQFVVGKARVPARVTGGFAFDEPDTEMTASVQSVGRGSQNAWVAVTVRVPWSLHCPLEDGGENVPMTGVTALAAAIVGLLCRPKMLG